MLNEEVFETLKGFGYIVKMFDKNGRGPMASPNLAVYISANDANNKHDNIMIRLPEDALSEYPEVVIYKSKDSSENFLKLFKTIKNIALGYGNTISIRQFGKNIEPKDLAFIPAGQKEENNEIIESAKYDKFGSTKSSYHIDPKTKKAKVIIRHSKAIDENIMGARSRNVKALFVENHDGERRKLPTKSLMAGRALANHINHGGGLYDESANNIIKLSEDIGNIRKLKKLYPVLEDADNTKIHSAIEDILTGVLHIMKSLNSDKITEYLPSLEINPPNLAFAEAFYKDKLGEEYDAGCLARGSILASKFRK